MPKLTNLYDFFFMDPGAGREGGPSAIAEVREKAAKHALKAVFEASHAGKINMNRTLYLPDGMKKSLSTWVSPQNRPVQVHHDGMADPIGRVIEASYLNYNISEALGSNQECEKAANSLNDAENIQDVFDSISALENLGVLEDPNWRGVGELELGTVITDSLAVEKFLDGRYLGVSIGYRPNHAYCSICHKDWVEDGSCKHDRGEIDEESGKKQFLIVDGLTYKELSPVNSPADLHSKVKTLALLTDAEDDGAKQFHTFDENSLDHLVKNKVSFTWLDQEGSEMSDTATQEPEAPVAPAVESKVDEALRVLFEDENAFTEELAEIINEALEEAEGDAKLTTEKRKSLPSSSFCGPSRSFPVPSCANYTAAKRLIGRYKGPGDKGKIMACVERKGKALGCEGAKKEGEEIPVVTEKTDKELRTLFSETEQALIKRGLKVDRECKVCQEKDTSLAKLAQDLVDSQGTVEVLRSEYKYLVAEQIGVQDSFSQTSEEYKNLLVEFIKLKRVLNRDETQDDFKSSGLKDLRNLLDQVDISNTLNLLAQGISQEVEADSVSVGEANLEVSQRDSEIGLEKDEINAIVASISSYGRKFAEEWLEQLKKNNKVDTNISLDSLIEYVRKSDIGSRG